MILSQNQKQFSVFFSASPKSTKNLEYFQKKFEPQRWFPSEIIHWEKQCYLNAQKNPVSQHLWTVNILKGLKHCLNLHRNIFVIFFDNS